MSTSATTPASVGLGIARKPEHRARRRKDIKRLAEVGAAAASIAMIVLSAALPNERAASPADAFEGRPPAFSTVPENVFGAYLGAPYHYPSDFHLSRPDNQVDPLRDMTIKNVEWFTDPFKNPLYYGARLIHWWPDGRFGAMVDFTHSKAYAPFDKDFTFKGSLDGQPLPETGKVKDYFKLLSFSHGHNMLTFNGLVRLANFGAVWPYLGAGAGISLPHTEIDLRAEPKRTYEYQFAGLNVQGLFGIEFRLSMGSVFLEYKYTFADYRAPITRNEGNWLPFDLWRQFSRWWSGAEPPGGWGETQLASHQVIGGFYFRFVPDTPATK